MAPFWSTRPRVRLSLQASIVLTLALGTGIGYIVRSERDQRVAVEAIKRARGSVVYEWQWRDGAPDLSVKPWWPAWLLDRLGPDYFFQVKQVGLSGGNLQMGPREVAALTARVTRLRGLEKLELLWFDDVLLSQLLVHLDGLEKLEIGCGQQATEAGLVHLQGLKKLRELKLMFLGAAVPSLRCLEGLTRLKKLILWGTISDRDLADLKGLTNVEWLDLALNGDPEITDAGLSQLRSLVNLKAISVHSTNVTSEGLVTVRDMTRLQHLNLGSCGITDLTPVRHLSGLTFLSLDSTPIDDVGLAPLVKFTRLEFLNLNNTGSATPVCTICVG